MITSLIHCCTAWALTRTMTRMINGSRCLHIITGEDYRAKATTPVYELVLAVRKRRMRRWRENNTGWSVRLQPLISVVSWDPLGLIWITIYISGQWSLKVGAVVRNAYKWNYIIIMAECFSTQTKHYFVVEMIWSSEAWYYNIEIII